MHNIRLLFVTLLVGTACSDLPDSNTGFCGNTVVDEEEDCDGSSPFGEGSTCAAPGDAHECFLVCDIEAGSLCPEGWGCGVDGRCRRPSGQFEFAAASPWRFPVDEFAVGDVDGDGLADLIGNGSTTITVRFGDAEGGFGDELDIFTREPSGPVTYQDMNRDGRLDVIVPLLGGLSTLLGTEDRDLEPVAYAPLSPGAGRFRVLPLPTNDVINIVADFLILGGAENGMAFPDTPDDAVIQIPGGHSIADLAGRPPVGLLNRGFAGFLQAGRYSVALPFIGEDRVWLVNSEGNVDDGNLAPAIEHVIALPPTVQVGPGGAIFADVDGSNELDVVIDVDAPGGRGMAVALDQGGGALGDNGIADLAVQYDIRIDGGAIPFGDQEKLQFPLAMADLTDDGRVDFVTPQGIFVTSIGSFDSAPNEVLNSASFATSDPWVSATVADVNADGIPDVAVAQQQTDGLFVYLGTGVGLFNRFFLSTELPPRTLRTGDFDGDLIEDVAFVLRDADDIEPDQVWVSFGSRTGSPSEPVFMGELGRIESLEPALVPTVAGIDVVTDLVVTSEFASEEGSSYSVAILEGSSTRRMVSPFALRVGDDIDIPLRAVTGSFTSPGSADVVIVATPLVEDAPNGQAGPPETFAWLLQGTGTGQFDVTQSTRQQFPDNTGFNAGCAVWAVGDLDQRFVGDAAVEELGTDEIIGIDGVVPSKCAFNAGAFSLPNLFVAEAASPLDISIGPVPDDSLRGVDDVNLFDADLDGDLDMVTLYRGEFRASEGGDVSRAGDGVVVYWNNDDMLVNSSALDGGDLGVRSVAPILFQGDDAVPELLILGNEGLFLSTLDLSTRTFGPPQLIFPTFDYRRFEVGDLNGDGLTDVAMTFGSQVDVLLSVPAAPRGSQQTSRGGDVDLPEPLPQGGGE